MSPSNNTVLLIGEGANRYSSGMKRQRYEEALGGEPPHPARAAKRAEDRRTGEVAVVAEVVVTLGLAAEADTTELLSHADRVCAMLTRLVKRYCT